MFLSIGDQARNFAMQSQASRLKQALSVLTHELSSGEVDDVAMRLNGNTRTLSLAESRLNMLGQFRDNIAELTVTHTTLQASLGQIQDATRTLAVDLSSGLSGINGVNVGVQSAAALTAFEDVVARLNGSSAGQFLYAGTATDRPPVAAASDILDMLGPLVAGLIDANSVMQVVTDWFDAAAGGGGFVDLAYAGSLGSARVIPVSTETEIALSIDASAEPLRRTLAGLALGALVQKGALSGSEEQQVQLLQKSGAFLLENDAAMAQIRGELGQSEQRVARVSAENQARTAQLTLFRNSLREADPSLTATAITTVETRLEALMTVQARLSDLRLVSFLK
jgi:flagellar hook-associated protein 3 FlgL